MHSVLKTTYINLKSAFVNLVYICMTFHFISFLDFLIRDILRSCNKKKLQSKLRHNLSKNQIINHLREQNCTLTTSLRPINVPTLRCKTVNAAYLV